MRLSVRIPLLVAASVVVAAAAATGVSAWRTSELLRDQAARQLVALREARSEALRRYVDVVEQRVATITTSDSTLRALIEFGVAVRRIDESMSAVHDTLARSYSPEAPEGRLETLSPREVARILPYRDVHERYHSWFKALTGSLGIDDVMLVSRTGMVIYSTDKSRLFGSNLLNGQWRDGPAGKLFHHLASRTQVDGIAFSDMVPDPAYGNTTRGYGAFGVYRGAGAKAGNTLVGAVVVAIAPDALNEIMSSNQGMGETGETYLVGADGVMRTDSRFIAGAMNEQRVDTESVRRALAGEGDVVEVVGYRGIEVLSAFEPVSIFAHDWALLAEIDKEEVLAPVGAAIRDLLAAVGVVLTLVIAAAVMVGRSLAAPIVRTANMMARVVDAHGSGTKLGDLPEVAVPPNATLEVREIASGIRAFVDAVGASERRLTALLEAAPDGTLIVDMDGTIEFANDRAAEMFAMDRDAMIGHPVDLLVPEEIRGRHVGLRGLFASEARSREMGVGTALEAVRADGSRFPVEISLSPIETESGTVVFAAVRDISDRRKAERALRDSQQVSRLLQESLDTFSDAVILYDNEERVVFSNDAYHRIYPAAPPKGEIIGRTMESLLRSTLAAGQAASPLATSDPEAWIRQSLEDRRKPEGGSGESVHTNGRTYFYRFGRTTEGGTLLVRYDITEQKEAERRIQESATLMRTLIESINSVIFVKDLEGRHIIVNSVYERATGIPAGEVIGKTDFDFMPHDVAKRIAERDADIIRNGRMETFEEEVPSRDGGTRHYLTTKAPMTDENGVVFGMCGIATDITDLKALQGELIDAKSIAEEAAMAKSAFLATMSHEIRTPMNGVVTMAEILDQTRLTADQREMTRTIRQSADALLTIINDILDFSKIEAGQLAIENLSFDLLDQIEGVVDLIAPRAEAAGLLLTVDVEDGLPAQVRGDPGRLRQILLNLSGNAVKFTESGGIAVRVVHGTSGPGWIRVEIDDTGIGMSEEQISRLFQAFSQAESSTARRFGGTGLGLAICKRLSELMGGEIGVSSTPGEGSVFWIELPLAADGERIITSSHDLSGARVVLAGYSTREGTSIEHALRLGGVGAVLRLENPADIRAPDESGGVDLVLLNGRPGVPSIVDWSRWVPERLALDRPCALVTAPHMALSALRIDQTVIGPCDHLGTMTVPLRARRLWDHVAVAIGAMPRSALEETSEAARTYAAPDHESARAGNAMVLVVEDNETNQVVIKRVLDRLGIAHEMAENGQAALDHLAERSFDLVLSDFHMPVMDGFEFTRRYRAIEADRRGATKGMAQGKRLPIVALTADVLPDTASKAEEVGMDGYLRKPIEIAALEAVLRGHVPNAFDLRRPETELEAALPPSESGAPASETAYRNLLADVDPDIYDPDALNDAFGGFDEAAARFVLSFTDDSRTRVAALHAAFEAGDWAAARDAAHAMKGAALSSGAMRLGHLMREIQDSLDEDDPDTADIYRDGLDETVDELAAALDPLRRHLTA